MKRLLFILLFITAASHAWAASEDTALPADGRIKLLKYDESDVYTITTKYGYQTNIVFGPNEEIQTISVGDRSLWQIIPSGNRLFIRPMEDGAQTNMTLITSKHSYQFDLKSLADGKTTGNIYVARFLYADDKPKPAALPPAADPIVSPFAPAVPAHAPAPPPVVSAPVKSVPVATPVAAAQPLYPNYNYTYSGPDEASPVQVYDDGKSTFIQYHDCKTLPSVYMIDADGKATSVNYYIQGDLMVVEAVAGEWRLEGNNGTVTLYNEMLNSK